MTVVGMIEASGGTGACTGTGTGAPACTGTGTGAPACPWAGLGATADTTTSVARAKAAGKSSRRKVRLRYRVGLRSDTDGTHQSASNQLRGNEPSW